MWPCALPPANLATYRGSLSGSSISNRARMPIGLLSKPIGSQFFQGTAILRRNHELLSAWGRPNQHAEVHQLLHVRPQWVVPPQMNVTVVVFVRSQSFVAPAIVCTR